MSSHSTSWRGRVEEVSLHAPRADQSRIGCCPPGGASRRTPPKAIATATDRDPKDGFQGRQDGRRLSQAIQDPPSHCLAGAGASVRDGGKEDRARQRMLTDLRSGRLADYSPRLPRIRTCGFPGSGSSAHGFATLRWRDECAAVAADSSPAAEACPSTISVPVASGGLTTCATRQ